MYELVAVQSGDQWLVCASWLLFCQEANGWCVCDMVAVLSVGQWLACEMIAVAYGWRVYELVAVLSGGQWLVCVCVSWLLFCQEAIGWCV